jgi:hypothetical protein
MSDRVDRNTLRTNQFFICALTLLGFILGTEAGRWLVLFTGLVLLAGTAVPSLALFKQVHRRILKPTGILGSDIHVEDPTPHQFAQGMGGVVLLIAAVALFSGAALAGWVLGAIVFTFAFVNLTVNFCAGCFIYYQLDRVGLLPKSIAGSRGTH